MTQTIRCDFATLGAYTKDTIVSKAGTRHVDGGGYSYAAHAARLAGLEVAAITRRAEDSKYYQREMGTSTLAFTFDVERTEDSNPQDIQLEVEWLLAADAVRSMTLCFDNLDVFVLGLDSHAWTTFWGLREPMTLEVTVNQSSSTIPVQVDMHIAATAGIVTETAFVLTRDGIPVPGIGESMPAGLSLDRILAIDVPGAYELIVSRTGFTGPGGPVTLTKQFTIPALSPLDPPPPPPPPPPALTPPVIDAVPFGTVDSALIEVTGTGFLPNRPPAGEPMTQGIGIRMVDFNSLQEIGRDFTSSFADGTVRWEIKELDLRELLAVDAIVTLAISATDGTLNPQDVTGFLWSNTDTVSYLKPQE